MIYLHKIDKDEWLVQYRGQLKRVNTREYILTERFMRRRSRMALLHMRYAITKATRLSARQFRFIDNTRINGMWATQWTEI